MVKRFGVAVRRIAPPLFLFEAVLMARGGIRSGDFVWVVIIALHLFAALTVWRNKRPGGCLGGCGTSLALFMVSLFDLGIGAVVIVGWSHWNTFGQVLGGILFFTGAVALVSMFARGDKAPKKGLLLGG